MIGKLPVKPSEFAAIPGARLAIVASMWHSQFVNPMVARAKLELLRLEVAESDISTHFLPGSLELVSGARTLFELDLKLDGILAFGIVLKGSTTHDTSIIQQVNQGFTLVSDRFGKPIVNEVFGVSDLDDAEKRSGNNDMNKGLEAVFVISEFLSWKRQLMK